NDLISLAPASRRGFSCARQTSRVLQRTKQNPVGRGIGSGGVLVLGTNWESSHDSLPPLSVAVCSVSDSGTPESHEASQSFPDDRRLRPQGFFNSGLGCP